MDESKLDGAFDRDERRLENPTLRTYFSRSAGNGIIMPTPIVISIPTESGTMVKVDAKGRIVLPQEIRERLGMTPGTEVEIHEADGTAVVEPEDSPEQIIDRMNRLVAETAANRQGTTPITDDVDPIAQKHRAAVRRGAENDNDE